MATKNEAKYVGLDIGTSKVVCIVGLLEEGSPQPGIIGVGIAQSNGVRRGVIVDIEEAVSSITAALEEAERMSGLTVERATISVDGGHVQSLNSRGVIAVGRADHEITREDLARVEDAAAAISVENNRETLRVIPKSYIVDGQGNIADPVGMNGLRLEVDTHIITVATPAMKNLDNAVYRAGISITNHQIVPLAAARSVLTKKQKELGVAVIDVGAETTGVVVFEEGQPSFTTIIPIGSNHITKDLIYGLRTNIDVAEKIKQSLGRAQAPKNNKKEKVNLKDFGGNGEIARGELDMIVNSRVGEIFTMVHGELRKAGKDSMLASGVVLTGGGANLEGIAEFASTILKLPVVIGKPTGFGGITDKVKGPGSAAAIGLMLEDMDQPADKSRGLNNSISKIMTRVKNIFKSFLP